MAANPEGVVSIHGKQYKTVAYRINEFREKHPDYSIVTELVSADDERVVVRASVLNGQTTLATGYAEEVRASSNINRTSAIENAETSAVGRALAFFGLAGTEIASADEVANAIKQQGAIEQIEYMALVREHWDLINEVKTFLIPDETGKPNIEAAREALAELDDKTKIALWRAPTKGGVFTTKERDMLKQPEKYV